MTNKTLVGNNKTNGGIYNMKKAILKQGLNERFGLEKFGELNMKKAEIWTKAEIMKIKEIMKMDKIGPYISQAIWDNELELKEIPHLVAYINAKRGFMYSIKGKTYRIAIPSDREITEGVLNSENAKLLKLAMTYYEWEDLMPVTIEDEKNKKELWEKFVYIKNSIGYAISARLFSKKFAEKYKMNFTGMTGVALTGNVEIDYCEIPKEMAKKLSINHMDRILVIRHPFQNIMVSLKVRNFTLDNTIRVNSLVFKWLGGDHDGDKINVIPVKNLFDNNEEFFDCVIGEFDSECFNISPSNILKQLDNPLYENIEVPTEEHKGFRTTTTMDMIEESKKSEKFCGTVTEQDYIDNQYSTVLNMRTVKEGTAFAGAFCNWLMEVCHLHGELDERVARRMCDLIQQTALDSKHNSATGKGYTGEVWFKITELRRTCKGLDRESIKERLIKILEGESELTDENVNYDEVLD